MTGFKVSEFQGFKVLIAMGTSDLWCVRPVPGSIFFYTPIFRIMTIRKNSRQIFGSKWFVGKILRDKELREPFHDSPSPCVAELTRRSWFRQQEKGAEVIRTLHSSLFLLYQVGPSWPDTISDFIFVGGSRGCRDNWENGGLTGNSQNNLRACSAGRCGLEIYGGGRGPSTAARQPLSRLAWLRSG
jgi:hypothetical protein